MSIEQGAQAGGGRPRWGDRDWYGEQNAAGVDLSLIRERLRLSPIERLRRMEQHAQEVLRLMEHGKRARGHAAGADRGGAAAARG